MNNDEAIEITIAKAWKKEDAALARQKAQRITCPACFGTEPDCDSCDGRGYFLEASK